MSEYGCAYSHGARGPSGPHRGRLMAAAPIPVPSLADLASGGRAVEEVPLEAVPGLLAHTAALQTALAARLAARTPAPAPAAALDRLLRPEEAAELLGVEVAWLRRRAGHLPFTRRLSRK